jgi:hypothetical protein
MFRMLQTLPVMLTLAALCVITTSCGSINQAQVRVINAIPDSGPTDIYFNGTRIIPDLTFGTVQPSTDPATYLAVGTGTNTVQGFQPGDIVNPIAPIGSLALNGLTQYTVIAVGLELNDAPPLLLVDDNTVPVSGNVEFRIINVSPSSPLNGLDVYFVPPGTDITNFTPQIRALSNGQASPYQPLTYISGGYAVVITASGSKTPLITQSSASPSGSITTMVIIDNPGGMNGMSRTPLVLQDLN